MEVPDVEIHHLETPSPINVGGFKGMGEGGCINVAPAIANAIADALAPIAEVRIDSTPIRPQMILEQLRQRAGTRDGAAASR
jgi:carbon-monoxide dehydrogenase large subunit